MPATKFWIKLYNGLLEPKHVKALRDAVWLYLWFLDHKTSKTEDPAPVLYGRPIPNSRPADDLGVDERTIRRWLDRILKHDYIRRKRTPYGYRYWIMKARKEGD